MSQMNQLYIRRGQDFSVTTDDSIDIQESLPVGVYRLSTYPFIGWVFGRIDDFSLPPKLYGNLPSQAKRILGTYRERLSAGNSTGVLLSGSKGAGKTLLAKKVAIDSNLPVIVINQPHNNDSFKEIVAGLGECVIIFDEFEKVYADSESQNALLTLFDGVFNIKALMFVIINDENRMVTHMINRPGRLYYSLKYEGLDREFIEDYCRDRLDNKDRIIGVLSVTTMFPEFNFDMLQALIEEMNRYDEAASEAVKYLNIQHPRGSYVSYQIRAFDINSGKEFKLTQDQQFVRGHPLSGGHTFCLYIDALYANDDKETVIRKSRSINIVLSENNIVKVDPQTDTYIFEDSGCRLLVTKESYDNRFYLGGTTRRGYEQWSQERQIYTDSDEDDEIWESGRSIPAILENLSRE